MKHVPMRVIRQPDQLRWMRASAAARRIGVSRQRVTTLIQEGRFEAVVYFHEVYVSRAQVVEYVAAAAADENYMTIDDVAGHFGVHRSTVSAWVKAGRLPHVTIQRRRMFDRETVEQFVPPSIARHTNRDRE